MSGKHASSDTGTRRTHEQSDRGQRTQDGGGGGRSGQEDEQHKTSIWVEKVVSGISLLLLLAAIGYLVWEGVGQTQPPSFDATVKSVRHPLVDGGDYYVLLEVRNKGGLSVQNLGIDAQVKDGQTTLAQTSTSLSWLPAYSKREVTVILGADPGEHTLEISFSGFENP